MYYAHFALTADAGLARLFHDKAFIRYHLINQVAHAYKARFYAKLVVQASIENASPR